MIDYTDDITHYFSKLSKTLESMNMSELNEAMNAIVDAYERDATIYIFGNGGSAATASHFVCDFNKGISDGKEKKFHMECLSDNTPILTAIANDISYEAVFRYQLEKVLLPTDLVIAISGSGNSKNVVSAIEYAKDIGCKTIGITGYNGGIVKKIVDYNMHANIDDMQVSEDVHMILDHMMYCVFRKHLKNC